SKAQGAAGHGALSQGAMMLPFLLPGSGSKARRLAAKVWKNRPGIGDTLFYIATAAAAHLILRWSWLASFAVFACVMAVLVTLTVVLEDRGTRTTTTPTSDDQPTSNDTDTSAGTGCGEGVGVDG